MLDKWAAKWTDFLKECTTDSKTGKTTYIHKRLKTPI